MTPSKGEWKASGNGVHVGHLCVATTHMEPRDQRHADARLIAAAPDLLEAAEWAHDLIERVGDSRKDAAIIEALAKAIAKARGDK